MKTQVQRQCPSSEIIISRASRDSLMSRPVGYNSTSPGELACCSPAPEMQEETGEIRKCTNADVTSGKTWK